MTRQCHRGFASGDVRPGAAMATELTPLSGGGPRSDGTVVKPYTRVSAINIGHGTEVGTTAAVN